MMLLRTLVILLGSLTSIFSWPVYGDSKAELYRILHDAEAEYGLPHNTLVALAYTESSMSPYAINADGVSFYPQSKGHAIQILRTLNLNPYVIKVKTKDHPKGTNLFFQSAQEANRALEQIRQRNSLGDLTVTPLPVKGSDYYRRLNLKNTGLCLLQISNMFHGSNVGRTVNEILDLNFCVSFAANYLKGLVDKHGLKKGVGCYYTCGVTDRAKRARTEYFARFNRHYQRLNTQSLALAGNQ